MSLPWHSIVKTELVKTITRCSLSGLIRSRYIQILLGMAFVLPPFAFISQDVYFSGHSAQLFIEFQYGFQHWFLFLCGLSFLHISVGYDESVGMKSALRAAGVQPAQYLLGKFICILICLLCVEIVLSLYTWGLSLVWKSEIQTLSNASIVTLSKFSSFLMGGWLNMMGALMVTCIAYLLWTLTGQQLLGYLGASVIWIVGMSKPVVEAFFLQSEQFTAYKVIGWTFKCTVPSFHHFDLWFVSQNAEATNLALHFVLTTLFGFALLAVILFASWKTAVIKRT